MGVACGALARARAGACAGERDRGEMRGLKLGLDAQVDAARPASASSPAAATAGRRASGSTTGRISPNAGPRTSGLHEVYARFDDEERIYRQGDRRSALCARQGRDAACRPSGDPVGAVRSRRRAARPCASSPIRAPPRTSAAWRICCGSRSSTATSQDGGPARTFPPAAGRDAGRRDFRQAAMREADAGAPPDRRRRASCASPARATPTRRPASTRQGQFESWTRFEIFDPGYR